VHAAVFGFYIGVHTKAADHPAFSGIAEQVVVVVRFLRSGLKTALMIGVNPAVIVRMTRSSMLEVLKMTDEAGEDAKLVAVPHTKLSKEYDHIKDVNDLPELLKAQISHFFEHYKDLEKGKWVKVDGWDNAEAAKAEIVASFERAAKK
jgi:inorganic pyrophosphatase